MLATLAVLYGVRLYFIYTALGRVRAFEKQYLAGKIALVKGPTVDVIPASPKDRYSVIDLGSVLPIRLAPDGSLLYAKSEMLDGQTEWVHYLRNPLGVTKRIGVGSYSLTTRGQVLEAYESIEEGIEVTIDGKSVHNHSASFKKMGDDTRWYPTEIANSNGSWFVSDRYGHNTIHVWDTTDKLHRISTQLQPREATWKKVGRMIGVFEPASCGMATGQTAIDSKGVVYANLWQVDALYRTWPSGSAMLCKVVGDQLVPVLDDAKRQYNTRYMVCPSGEVVIHEYAQATPYSWPCILVGNESHRLPLPKTSAYGKVLGSSGNGKRIVIAGVGNGSLTYLWHQDHYVKLEDAIPEVKGARLSFEYLTWVDHKAKSRPAFWMNNPMAESGHFVAQKFIDKDTAHLLYFTPNTKSP